MKKLICGSLALICAGLAAAENDNNISLPTPNLKTNVSLKFAFEKRRTSRTFAPHSLSELDLSNLLWAAYGVNRVNGKFTAPTAANRQEVLIYFLTEKGAFSYFESQNRI